MTLDMFLEFDDFKLEVLREKAYELDLTLEAYISMMIEDMVSLNENGKETEPEKLMAQYITKKWENRENEPAIERFDEEYEHLIKESVSNFKGSFPTGTIDKCKEYVLMQLGEYIHDEMEFNCDHYIKKVIELIFDDIKGEPLEDDED